MSWPQNYSLGSVVSGLLRNENLEKGSSLLAKTMTKAKAEAKAKAKTKGGRLPSDPVPPYFESGNSVSSLGLNTTITLEL